MADKVQRVLEDMVPELLDLGKRNVFSEEEIKEIIHNRRNFEYKISSRTPVLKDYLEYLSYEYELERIRYNRTRNLKLKKRTIGDYSIIRLIHFIFKRALRKFPSDEKLWLQNIDFCLKSGSSKALQRNLIAALRNNPINSIFWLIMSDRELQNGNVREARSAMLLGLRVNKDSLILWRGISQLEINIAYKKYLESFADSELSTKRTVNKKSNINSILPIISYSQKKIKLDFKKQALLLFIYRLYYKLKRALLEDGEQMRIEGMPEFEEQILKYVNEFKASQPLFSILSIIHNVMYTDLDILEIFKNEMRNILRNSNIEYNIVTLTLICRLIYNCLKMDTFILNSINNNYEDEIKITDFGFHISESIEDVEINLKEKDEFKDDSNMNLLTWYSQTSLENIISRDNNCFREILKLIKLDPNFWNFFFLEDLKLGNIIEALSKLCTKDIENREICKEDLFSRELIDSLKKKIKHNLFNLKEVEFKDFIKDFIAKVNLFITPQEIMTSKLCLIEALNSLIGETNINFLTSESNSLVPVEELDFKSSLNEIPELIQLVKSFIIKNGINIQDSSQISFLTNSINKLLDLIRIQIDKDQKNSENLDFVGFSKCIYWAVLVANNNKFNEELSLSLSKLIDRIINDVINIIPRWLSAKKIPGFLFNALLIYSILKGSNENNQVNHQVFTSVLEYLKSPEAGLEIRFENSSLIEIIKNNLENKHIIPSINLLIEQSIFNSWIFKGGITYIPKNNRDITTITYFLTGITLNNISLEKHILNLISERNKGYINTSNIEQKLINTSFMLWNHLLLILNNIKDYSDQFKLIINIRYMLFIKLIEYLQMKRYLLSKFEEKELNTQFPTLVAFMSHIKKNNQNLLTTNLSSGLNISNLARISIDDTQFSVFLNRISSCEKNEDFTFDNESTETKPSLKYTISNILNNNEILIPTARFINLNYS